MGCFWYFLLVFRVYCFEKINLNIIWYISNVLINLWQQIHMLSHNLKAHLIYFNFIWLLISYYCRNWNFFDNLDNRVIFMLIFYCYYKQIKWNKFRCPPPISTVWSQLRGQKYLSKLSMRFKIKISLNYCCRIRKNNPLKFGFANYLDLPVASIMPLWS